MKRHCLYVPFSISNRFDILCFGIEIFSVEILSPKNFQSLNYKWNLEDSGTRDSGFQSEHLKSNKRQALSSLASGSSSLDCLFITVHIFWFFIHRTQQISIITKLFQGKILDDPELSRTDPEQFCPSNRLDHSQIWQLHTPLQGI